MMASYAAELSVEERWAVVAYIRALQLSQLTPAAELPPDVRQQLETMPDVGARAGAKNQASTSRGEAVSSPASNAASTLPFKVEPFRGGQPLARRRRRRRRRCS